MQLLLLKGQDKALLSQAVTDAAGEFLGDEDRQSALERFGERNYLFTPEDSPPYKAITALTDAARTPPMFSSKRVLVARELGYLGSSKAIFEPLLKYLSDPSPDVALILVWEAGPTSQTLSAVPQSVTKAVRDAGGEVRDVSPARPKRGQPNDWFDQQLRKSGVRLSGRARAMVWDWLGQKHGNLAGLLEVLQVTFGTEEMLEEDQIKRFLSKSEQGSIPFWNLTDAIDQGQRDVALETLRRLLGAGAGTGGSEPMQVIFLLHKHFEQMLRLDGAGVSNQAQAEALLKLPANQKFKAKRIVAQTRNLGSEKIARCLRFIAEADLDLRGRSGLDPEVVLEVLVARLASQRNWTG